MSYSRPNIARIWVVKALFKAENSIFGYIKYSLESKLSLRGYFIIVVSFDWIGYNCKNISGIPSTILPLDTQVQKLVVKY